MNTCIQCKEEYKAKRATSRYCSDKCRNYSNRGVSGTVGVTKLSGTPLSGTDATDKVSVSNKTTCPEVEHAQGCLRCSRLRDDEKDTTLQCDSKYYDCTKWGQRIDTYHMAMCA